jgi:hypothetical protein
MEDHAMSGHYEVVFSLFLRAETPKAVLDELHWHLGLSSERPDSLVIGTCASELTPNRDSYLPGGCVAILKRQSRGGA